MRETSLPSKTWTLILCILEGYYCFANNDKQEKMISSTMPTAAAVIIHPRMLIWIDCLIITKYWKAPII
jgi:hypothetical protein